MPRAVKANKANAGNSKPSPAKKIAKKPKSLYDRPEKIVEGTILTDLHKNNWRIGKTIGEGGFGEIYSACRGGDKNYDYVVKCEPHGNGPLFVEMHFYMRHAKLEDIKRFQRERNIKSLGMPHMLGNGSAEINGIKHRFIVMPRYGNDIAKNIAANGGRLPEATAYRLALQMVDVYEYIHSTGYVHSDLKGANILLGLGKAGAAQAYLVDFGLVAHKVTGEFKPDPKKMHNGTIQYTSRDAHLGVPTMRTDFEILGYNLIEWLGGVLPWVKANLLTQPVKVHKAKDDFMSDLNNNLQNLFPDGVPDALSSYLCYVCKLKYNEDPQYDECRKIFLNGLKCLKVPNTGDLVFKSSPVKRKLASANRNVNVKSSDDSSVDIVDLRNNNDSDSDEGAPARKYMKPNKKSHLPSKSPANRASPREITKKSPLSAKRPAVPKKATPTSAAKSQNTRGSGSSATPKSTNTTPRTKTTRSTPLPTTINFSPSISLSASRGARPRHGVTVINDNLTPNPRSGKTYEFNFELDVSMDANVIVNVNRKKKATAAASTSASVGSGSSRRQQSSSRTDNSDSPVTRVQVRKVADDVDVFGSDSPKTPTVTVNKTRRFVSPRQKL